MSCQHENFAATVDVGRLSHPGRDGLRFIADIKIKCDDCGKPMRFIGMPIGVDLNGCAVSANGTEARLAIHPFGEQVPGLSQDEPAGFRQIEQLPPPYDEL